MSVQGLAFGVGGMWARALSARLQCSGGGNQAGAGAIPGTCVPRLVFETCSPNAFIAPETLNAADELQTRAAVQAVQALQAWACWDLRSIGQGTEEGCAV